MQAEAVKATQRRTVWNVLRRNLSLTAGCLILLCVVFTALFPGLIASQSPTDQNLTAMLAAPSAEHIWGTDELGRDIFSRLLYDRDTVGPAAPMEAKVDTGGIK